MSFIIFKCSEDADPEENIIKLRTNPPTFIKLKPGENVLDVKDYPDLKYGFSQIVEDEDYYTQSNANMLNCFDVFEIDLSGFDGSEMTSMENMFDNMQNLKKIEFGPLDTSNVKSMRRMCSGCEALESVDMRGLDTSNVENMDYMFCEMGTFHTVINLSGLDVSNVKSMVKTFWDGGADIYLQGWHISKDCHVAFLRCPMPITFFHLEGCDLNTIKILMDQASVFFDVPRKKTVYVGNLILDKDVVVKFDVGENGDVTFSPIILHSGYRIDLTTDGKPYLRKD